MSKRQLFKKIDVSGNVEDLGYTLTADEINKLASLTNYDDTAIKNSIAGKVDKTTTINSKSLSSNITLTASDVDALPSDTELFSGSYNDLSNKPTLFSGNYNDLTNKPTIPTTASQVGALPNTTKYGASLSLSINTSTYVVTAQLKDQAGNNLGTEQTIDLPLESVVVSGSYDATNKKVILTLKDGSTIGFSVADLVNGLVPDTRKVAGIDLKDDITTTELSTALNLSQYANKVTSVNGKTGTVSLTAGDVGALPNTTAIPKLYNSIGENTDGAIDQATMTSIFENLDGMLTDIDNKASSKYSKPSTGIPKIDLASAVQTSLGKADTALQSIPAEYITETELNAKGYASTSAMSSAISSAVSSKANQSDLDTTNTNVSTNATNIQGLSTFYNVLSDKVDGHTTSISNLDNNKADKTDVQSRYNTLSTNKADKTELESAVTELNNTIDDVRELIGESQGTVVNVNGTAQSQVDFTSNPQDQIDTLDERTSTLIGKQYYIEDNAGNKLTRGEIFNDYASNVASGTKSHAEGDINKSIGNYSHTEGMSNTASGNDSHAEGFFNNVSGLRSHVEGAYNTVSGEYTHVEGSNNIATHNHAHVSGFFNTTGRDYQTIVGTRNDPKDNTLFEVGNGYFDDITGNVINQNAFEVREDGTLYIQNGTLTDGTNNVILGDIAKLTDIPDTSKYMTIDTDQTITSTKTFPSILMSGSTTYIGTYNQYSAPSSTQYYVSEWFNDTNNMPIAVSHVAHLSNGNIEHQIDVRRDVGNTGSTNTYAALKVGLKPDGTSYATAPALTTTTLTVNTINLV